MSLTSMAQAMEQETPRYKHFQPPMPCDRFMYRCGEIDVWLAEFSDGGISPRRRVEVILRHAGEGSTNSSRTYEIASNLKALERLAEDDDLYAPCLARAKLTGQWP